MTKEEQKALNTLSRQLTKKVNKFVKPLNVKKAILAPEFTASVAEREITFSFVIGERTNELFMEAWAARFPEIIDAGVTSFLMSILHEVGHVNDMYDVEFEELDDRDTLEALNNAGFIDEANNKYFELPTEQRATEWANIYIMHHLEECQKFDRECVLLINDFYALYVED